MRWDLWREHFIGFLKPWEILAILYFLRKRHGEKTTTLNPIFIHLFRNTCLFSFPPPLRSYWVASPSRLGQGKRSFRARGCFSPALPIPTSMPKGDSGAMNRRRFSLPVAKIYWWALVTLMSVGRCVWLQWVRLPAGRGGYHATHKMGPPRSSLWEPKTSPAHLG